MPATQTRVSRRALVVTVDLDTAKALREMLKFLGFEARIASTAQEALQLVNEFTPVLSIVDVTSPLIAGYDLVAKLSTEPRLVDCKFVALSQPFAAGTSRRQLAAGFQARLVKPVSLEALLATLVASGSACIG